MTVGCVEAVRHRVLVTGSRGKSSVVRMIFCGMQASGLRARARITGVLPRELSWTGTRAIVRNGPAHVEEMRWWLRSVPPGTEALVMENAAVASDLQRLAALWLRPDVVVWTNAYEDHQEAWGYGTEAACAALARGVPDEGTLVLDEALAAHAPVRKLLVERRGANVLVQNEAKHYMEANRALALAALTALGLGDAATELAVRETPPDVADFRVFDLRRMDAGLLAAAFAANDRRSTEALFALLGWDETQTCLLYGDRRDRGARRRAFADFLARPWAQVRVLRGDESVEDVAAWIRGQGHDGRVFGCGNVAGAPLALLNRLSEEGCEWTIPGVSA